MQIIASVIVVVCVVVGLGVLGALLMRRRRAMQARHAHAHWFHQLAGERVQNARCSCIQWPEFVLRRMAGPSVIVIVK